MSRHETLRPRAKWDLSGPAVALGITATVVGVGLFSIGAALVVGGITVTALAVLWPRR